jgi:hypothetical protein
LSPLSLSSALAEPRVTRYESFQIAPLQISDVGNK